MWLFFKNFILMILLPGTVTVWLPWFILNHAHVSVRWTLWRALALLPIVFGAGILLRCIWDFAVFGRGTLAPIDPPKHLVVRGLYRYVRNPMYVGMVLVVLGEAWFFFLSTPSCSFMKSRICVDGLVVPTPAIARM